MEGTIDKLDLIEPIKQVVPDKFKNLSKQSQKHPSINKGNLFDMLLLRSSRNSHISSKCDILKSIELVKEKSIEKPIEEPPIPNVLPNILILNTLPIKISIDDATTVAKSYVGHIATAKQSQLFHFFEIGHVKNITLKFVSFWDYNYSVNYTRNYKSKIIDVKGENFGST